MKVLLIYLRQDERLSCILRKEEGIRYNKLEIATPLALQILASLTPSGIKLKIVDDNFESIDFNGDYDLVGMHAHDALTAYRGREIYKEFKKRGIPVVIGGRFIQTIPVEAALECGDACIMSEGEYIWEQVLSDARKEKLQPVYWSNTLVDLTQKDIPLPNRHIVNNRNYLYLTIELARGCIYNCDFCTAGALFKGTYRTYPIERVENDLKNVLLNFDHKRNIIYFVDEDISMQREYKIELFRRIKKYNISWIALSNVAVGKDDELLDVLAKSGCKTLFIGFESLDSMNLKSINKPPTNKVKEYKEIVKNIHAHKIKICGLFIFGMDNDCKGVAKKALRFAKESKLDFTVASVLTPIFNSKIYLKLEQEGRIISKEWFKYWYKVVHQPRNVSSHQLRNEFNYFIKVSNRRALYKRLLRRFFSLAKKLWKF